MEPVRAKQHRKGQQARENQHYDAATTAAATAAPKTEALLRPIEDSVEQEEFEQARETSGTVVHFFSLKGTIEFNMKYAAGQNKYQH
jgi:alpha-D-ribose 1-methylphosphonate 5-triphosphate synthase subunit PhnG